LAEEEEHKKTEGKEEMSQVHLSKEDVFNLYAADLGKYPGLIRWYQHCGLIDLSSLPVAAQLQSLRRFTLPDYLGTIFDDINDPDDEGFTN